MRYAYLVTYLRADGTAMMFGIVHNARLAYRLARPYASGAVHRMSYGLYRDAGGCWDAPTFRYQADTVYYAGRRVR